MNAENDGRFPVTAWSVIRAAKDRDRPDYYQAMNRFIAGYWRPVFFFLRAKGYPTHRAEDLTQEFFLNFLDRDWIAKADPQRGRFRTYLLTILVRFLSDRGPRRAPKQKQFDERLVCVSALIADEDRTFDPPDESTPEHVFMKQWALATLANVQRQLEIWCRETKCRPDWYQVFTAFHFPPPGSDHISQDALAAQLKVSRDQVRYALHQTKEQFIELLRAEVADQVDSSLDIDTEIRELEELLEV